MPYANRVINRRSFLTAGGAAMFTLGHSILNGDDALAAAGQFTLNSSGLDRDALPTWPTLPSGIEAQDWRTGRVMWDRHSYTCQPYMASLPDGNLISTLTVGGGQEGGTDQHVIILRSTDRGGTWRQTAVMEPPEAPESSWGIPWYSHTTGRLYVWYTYNAANLRSVPYLDNSQGSPRVDSVGVVAYRSSSDGGETWGERRHLALPASDIDLRNPWGGTHRLFWTTGHAVQHGDAVYFGLSKMGTCSVANGGMFADTEAFIVKAVETSPGELAATLSAPIRIPGQPVNEEPFVVVFDDGLLSVTFRTMAGNLGEAVSTDDGASWTIGWARDRDGRVVPQPRGPSPQWTLPNGRVFLWNYNNNAVDGAKWGPRRPVFYRIGDRVGDRIAWGAPQLLIWEPTLTVNPNYPSMVVDGDAFLIAVSDKVTTKLFRFPLAGL